MLRALTVQGPESDFELAVAMPQPALLPWAAEPNDAVKPNTDKILKKCAKLVKTLCRHPQAKPFLQPVDPELDQVPDYPDVIRKPMDLGTVQQGLEARRYTDSFDVFTDVSLIWENCIEYNGPDSAVANMAGKMQRYFRDQWIQEELPQPFEEEPRARQKTVPLPPKARIATPGVRVVQPLPDTDSEDGSSS